MTRTMNMVLGSGAYLKRLAAKADAPVRLLAGLVEHQNAGLLDPTGTVHFDSPMQNTLLAHFGAIPEDGYLFFMYFKLRPDDATILATKATRLVEEADRLPGCVGMWLMKSASKIDELVIMSAWERELDAFAAKGAQMMAPVLAFVPIASSGFGYHEAAYKLVSPDDPSLDDEEPNAPDRPATLADLMRKSDN